MALADSIWICLVIFFDRKQISKCVTTVDELCILTFHAQILLLKVTKNYCCKSQNAERPLPEIVAAASMCHKGSQLSCENLLHKVFTSVPSDKGPEEHLVTRSKVTVSFFDFAHNCTYLVQLLVQQRMCFARCALYQPHKWRWQNFFDP